MMFFSLFFLFFFASAFLVQPVELALVELVRLGNDICHDFGMYGGAPGL